MNIPAEAIIPREKLTRYLSVWRAASDKSRFLARAGFTLRNPEALEDAVRRLNVKTPATHDSANEYGEFYSVNGDLEGRNSVTLSVTTIWLKRKTDGTFRFITLNREEGNIDEL